MPYSGPDDDTLPENVKKLPANKKAQWVEVFNSAMKKCTDDGGDDCEGASFAQANGVAMGGEKKNAIVELWEQIKRVFAPHLIERTVYLPMQTSSLVVTRQADGRARWLLIAASAVINKVGAIDSTMLFDNFIKHARETGEYPALDFLHQEDNVRLGSADWLARDRALYLASGVFDDTDLGRGALAGIEANPEYWGASISYRVTQPPLLMQGEGMIPVYTDGVNNYISIVPRRMAANLFTTASIAEEVRMEKRDFDELVRLVGAPAAQRFADEADGANRTITDAGMVVRADTAPVVFAGLDAHVQTGKSAPVEPVAVVRQDAQPTQPTVTLEALAAMVQALAERVDQLKVGGDTAAESTRATNERSVKLIDELAQRMVGVEASKARWDAWLDDAPAHIKDEAKIFRARDQATGAQMTSGDVAAETMKKINARHR